jgi:uncharacterized membrane protein (UPF0136 family)
MRELAMTNQPASKNPVAEDEKIQTRRVQSLLKVKYIVSVIAGTFLPLLYFLELYFRNYTSVSEWGLLLLLNASLILFLFLIMPYHNSSVYLRYALPIAFLIIAARSLTDISGIPFWPADLATSWLNIVVNLALIVYFTRFSIRALWGYIYQEPTIHLAFPLRSGCYAVGHGGSNTAINYHAVNIAQHYANDIVKLNYWGTRARGIYPRQLGAYCIFGDIVHSPCDGLIVNVVDGLPDLTPAEMDPTHVAGNHVIIMYHDRKVLLAHLQQDSILVKAGEQVYEGQPIGKVGNSGNTSEPHLHIHAEQGGRIDQFGDGVGMPIIFKEKGFLKRNNLLIVKDKP